MNWNYCSTPELYKEVEVLLKDGTTRKDMMIKGKYVMNGVIIHILMYLVGEKSQKIKQIQRRIKL